MTARKLLETCWCWKGGCGGHLLAYANGAAHRHVGMCSDRCRPLGDACCSGSVLLNVLSCREIVIYLGCSFQVVFAGFSAESLTQRIADCRPKVVLTCNAVQRGSKTIFLKDIVDTALGECAKDGVHVGTHVEVSHVPQVFESSAF